MKNIFHEVITTTQQKKYYMKLIAFSALLGGQNNMDLKYPQGFRKAQRVVQIGKFSPKFRNSADQNKLQGV